MPYFCLHQISKTEAEDLRYPLPRRLNKIKPGLQKLEFKDTRKGENISKEHKDTTNQKQRVWLGKQLKESQGLKVY